MSVERYVKYMNKEAAGFMETVTSAPGDVLAALKDAAILAAVPGVVVGAVIGAAASKVTSPSAQDAELLQKKMLSERYKKRIEERVRELNMMGVNAPRSVKRSEDLLNVR